MINKILMTFTLIFAVASAQADAVYLVDFNQKAVGSYPGGGVSEWNVPGNPGDLSGGLLLHDKTGGTSENVSLDYTGTMQDSNSAATNNKGPSWVYTAGNTGAMGDYFYTDFAAAYDTFTLELTLHEGDEVAVDLFVARDDAAADGFYEFSNDGGSSWQGFSVFTEGGIAETLNGWGTFNTQTQSFHNQADGWSNGRYMNSGPVVIGAAGTFLVRATDASNASNGYTVLNAMQVTVIPEPASLTLLIGGFLAVVTFKRRRS